MKIFKELMPSLSISDWATSVLRKHVRKMETESIESLCAMTMASDGEYSSLLLAERILNVYKSLDDSERLAFFRLLCNNYDLDITATQLAVDRYTKNPNADNLKELSHTTEPLRQELLRRINLAPEGTYRLVKMREDLLRLSKNNPEIKKIDVDFLHLFSTWFNRGFLVMQPIDWTTPAHILEKIIAYEAVHEIKSWGELRARLKPEDRECYAFFHPSMEDDPLVFVEVALANQMPKGISEILHREDQATSPNDSNCAIFYSISNCHKGLAGVSFGNFLIKQVAIRLKMKFPQLKTFTTISPAPGLRNWLERIAQENGEVKNFIDGYSPEADEKQQKIMMRYAAEYFLKQKNSNKEPLDPVARFHLKNGAQLERINIFGDISETGLKNSLGTMVNYVYDLATVEENHESYMHKNSVICSHQVKKLLS